MGSGRKGRPDTGGEREGEGLSSVFLVGIEATGFVCNLCHNSADQSAGGSCNESPADGQRLTASTHSQASPGTDLVGKILTD